MIGTIKSEFIEGPSMSNVSFMKYDISTIFDDEKLLGLRGGTFRLKFLNSSIDLAFISLGRTSVIIERLIVLEFFCAFNFKFCTRLILNLFIAFELGFSIDACKTIFSPGTNPPVQKMIFYLF